MKIFPTEVIVKGEARVVSELVASLELLRGGASFAQADFSLRALAAETAGGDVSLSGLSEQDIVFAALEADSEDGGGVWAHYANENHLFFLVSLQLWIAFGREEEEDGLHFSASEDQLRLGARDIPLSDLPMILHHEIYQELLRQCEPLELSALDRPALKLLQREIKEELHCCFQYALRLSRLRRAGLSPQLARALRHADAGVLTEALAELGEISTLGMEELLFAIAYHLLDGSRPRPERCVVARACYERYFALADACSAAESERADLHYDCALLCKEGGDEAGAIEHAEAAVALYRRLDGAESDLANALNNLGKLYGDARQYARAEETYEECQRLYEQQPDTHVEDLAALHYHRGLLYKDAQRAADAEHSLTRARDLYEQLAESSPQHELVLVRLAVAHEVLAELAAARGDDPAAVEAYRQLVRVLRHRGKLELAEKRLLHVCRLYEELVTTYSRRVDILADQAEAWLELGNVQDDMHKHSAAEKSMRQSIALYEELTERKPELYQPELAMVYYNLSLVYEATQRATLAERALLRSLRLFDAHLREHPEGWQFEYAMLLNNLAAHYGRQNKPRKGEGYMERAVAIRERLAQQDPSRGLPVLIESLLNRGMMHGHRGRIEVAIADVSRAVGLAEQLVASGQSKGATPLAVSLMELGRIYANAHRYAEARKVFVRSRALYEEIYPDAVQRESSPVNMLTEWIEMISEQGEYRGERPRLYLGKRLGRALVLLLPVLWVLYATGRLLWRVFAMP